MADIRFTQTFLIELNSILEFISKDSVSRANKFERTLKKEIENLVFMPFKYRKSIYYENNNIRDLIFKGYTIIYQIEEEYITIKYIFKYINF